MDEEDEEWKRLMEEKLLHSADQPGRASDQVEDGFEPSTTVFAMIDPLTGRPVQVTRHVERVVIPDSEMPEEVVSLVRSMQSNLQSGRPAMPVDSGLDANTSQNTTSPQVTFRHLDKDEGVAEEIISTPKQTPLLQLLSKLKKSKLRPLSRFRAKTRVSDDDESASEAEDMIPKESRHDEQNIQLKCVA